MVLPIALVALALLAVCCCCAAAVHLCKPKTTKSTKVRGVKAGAKVRGVSVSEDVAFSPVPNPPAAPPMPPSPPTQVQPQQERDQSVAVQYDQSMAVQPLHGYDLVTVTTEGFDIRPAGEMMPAQAMQITAGPVMPAGYGGYVAGNGAYVAGMPTAVGLDGMPQALNQQINTAPMATHQQINRELSGYAPAAGQPPAYMPQGLLPGQSTWVNVPQTYDARTMAMSQATQGLTPRPSQRMQAVSSLSPVQRPPDTPLVMR